MIFECHQIFDLIDNNIFFNRPPVQVDLIPGSSFFGIPEGHVKQKMGEFNISGESEFEFEFRMFQKTAFIASVLNGQVCGFYRVIQSFYGQFVDDFIEKRHFCSVYSSHGTKQLTWQNITPGTRSMLIGSNAVGSLNYKHSVAEIFAFLNPVLLDNSNACIAHCRLKKDLG